MPIICNFLSGLFADGSVHGIKMNDRVFRTFDNNLMTFAGNFYGEHNKKRVPLIATVTAHLGKPMTIVLKDEEGNTGSGVTEFIVEAARKHAKGKAANDIIFAASKAAVAKAAEIGADKVTNATIGAILDEEGKLVCLPTVEKVLRSLPTDELIAYAPISGLPDYLEAVLTATFGTSRPEGYMAAVATAGGTGVIHHSIWNYTDAGEVVLTSDWYWGPYNVLCKDMGRTLETYKMLDADNNYNLPALKIKVNEILARQNNLLLVINTPAHNPTGYSLTDNDIEGVIACLKEATAGTNKTAILLLDIAYIDYAGEKEEVRKFFKKLSNLPENILTIVAYSMRVAASDWCPSRRTVSTILIGFLFIVSSFVYSIH